MVAGIFTGIVGLYVGGAVLKVTGKWLGDQSDHANIRAAIAWSSVPGIWALLLWVPEWLVFGMGLFTTSVPRILEHVFVYAVFGSLEVTAGVWGLVVFCEALGQVQGFSVWRAFASALLAM